MREELNTLKKMIEIWKESYKEKGGIDSLDDFRFEIDEVVYPYVRSLYLQGFITYEELAEFMRFCDEMLRELEKFIKGEL